MTNQGTQCNIETVKSHLLQFREDEREIENQIERLERITCRLTGVGTQTLTGMPKAHSVSQDRFADVIYQKDVLEASIRNEISNHNAKKQKIENLIQCLKNSNERAVLRMRYFDGASWNEVKSMLFGWKDDYSFKEDSYLRRVHQLHRSALFNIAVVVTQIKCTQNESEET